jgi:hypothetical protein
MPKGVHAYSDKFSPLSERAGTAVMNQHSRSISRFVPRRLSHRIFRVPSTTDASANRYCANASNISPLRSRTSHAVNRYVGCVATVVCLLATGCPATIHRMSICQAFVTCPARIVSPCIDSINAMRLTWPISHVPVENLKVVPSATNSNIGVPLRNIISCCPGYHPAPNPVHVGFCHSVANSMGSSNASMIRFNPCLTATASASSSLQADSKYRSLASAFTFAYPVILAGFVFFDCRPCSISVTSNYRLVLLIEASAAFCDASDKATTTGFNRISAVTFAFPQTVAFNKPRLALGHEHSKSKTRQVLRPFASSSRIRFSHDKLLCLVKDGCDQSQQGRTIRPLARLILQRTKGQFNA